MPAANKTDNIELNQWLGNEYPKREDFNADNLKIDTAIKEASDDLATHLADTAPHGAVATATASKIVLRDAAARLFGNNNAYVESGVWATVESKSDNVADGGTLVTNKIIGVNQLYLAFLYSASNGYGVYSVGLLGVTAFITTLVAAPNITMSLDGTYHLVATNGTGRTLVIKINLIEVI